MSAIVGFNYFSGNPLFIRVVILLTTVGAAVFIALQTAQGRLIQGFFTEARLEVAKVVWPSRQETLQMSLLICIVVTLVAIMLWGMDALLGWLVSMLLSVPS
ncbi:MAG: preprotein translocase subunit SecE [Candidatus Eutrophobiaceae bacterium]